METAEPVADSMSATRDKPIYDLRLSIGKHKESACVVKKFLKIELCFVPQIS